MFLQLTLHFKTLPPTPLSLPLHSFYLNFFPPFLPLFRIRSLTSIFYPSTSPLSLPSFFFRLDNFLPPLHCLHDPFLPPFSSTSPLTSSSTPIDLPFSISHLSSLSSRSLPPCHFSQSFFSHRSPIFTLFPITSFLPSLSLASSSIPPRILPSLTLSSLPSRSLPSSLLYAIFHFISHPSTKPPNLPFSYLHSLHDPISKTASSPDLSSLH